MTDCTSCERMAKAEEAIDNLQEGAKSMDKKLDGLKNWMMAAMAGIIASIFVGLVKG